MVIDIIEYCSTHICGNNCKYFGGDRCTCPDYVEKVIPAIKKKLRFCPCFENKDKEKTVSHES